MKRWNFSLVKIKWKESHQYGSQWCLNYQKICQESISCWDRNCYLVQVSYSISMLEPFSMLVDPCGNGIVLDDEALNLIIGCNMECENVKLQQNVDVTGWHEDVNAIILMELRMAQ